MIKLSCFFMVFYLCLFPFSSSGSGLVISGGVFQEVKNIEYKNESYIFYNFACGKCYRVHQELVLNKYELNNIKIKPIDKFDSKISKNAAILFIMAESQDNDPYYLSLKIFQIIHSPLQWEYEKYRKLSTLEGMTNFYIDLGMPIEKFSTYLSVAEKILSKNNEFSKSLGVAGTPAVIVYNKWLTQGLPKEVGREAVFISSIKTALVRFKQ
ncbi:DsbA family protein [Pectobacterium cacticida]|uniref:DsbA family protein n=1 Tax=Pectobacterium cacticida TaxID=69221 RepID=UPI0039863FF0